MLQQLALINKIKSSGGYVALISVIIVSTVGAIVVISLLNISMSLGLSSQILDEGYSARALSLACANVALEKVRLDSSYVGDENIDFVEGNCSIWPVLENTGVYTLNVSGMVGSVTKKSDIRVLRDEDPDTSMVSLDIQSWQDVADF